MAKRVPVRRIDEVAAPVEKPGQNRLGLRHAGAPSPFLTEGHGAETERAHPQTGVSQGHVVIEWHVSFPLPRHRSPTSRRRRSRDPNGVTESTMTRNFVPSVFL